MRASTAATITAPLDFARAGVLRLLGRPLRTLLRDRSSRVAVHATAALVSTLLLACLAPLWAFALGPIVLGVPHLLADVRYLVVRPGLHKRLALALSVGSPIVVGCFCPNPAVGFSAGFGAILFARNVPTVRRALLLAAWGALVFVVATHPLPSQLALVHGHNVLAVLLFALGFARSRRVATAVVAGFAIASMAILGGALDAFLSFASGPITGADLEAVLDTLAPVSDPQLALRLTTLFVFAQGIHYAIWLRMVPDDARERPGLRSFASSLTALDRDVGKWVLGGAVLFAAVIALRASTSLEAARILYLRGASFHGQLEIAFALLLALEGRRALGLARPA